MIENGISEVYFYFLASGLLVFLLTKLIKETEKYYYYHFNKICCLHCCVIRKKLPKKEQEFLALKVPFYNKLSNTQRKVFEHRVAIFVVNYRFKSRGGLEISKDMKLLLAASAVTLTFGFRNTRFPMLDIILLYPKKYTSVITKKIHKGAYNPRLKTLVFSWEDFLLGNKIINDNINLGIHEFTHVIHLNSHKKKDLNSVIFKREFKALKKMIYNDTTLKKKLQTSGYIRKYGFKNQYEFIAVLLECFIETPKEFKALFPQIYKRIKKMLNFNFLEY